VLAVVSLLVGVLAAPPSAWQRTGARDFAECEAAERLAEEGHLTGFDRMSEQEGPTWNKRARQCPNAPYVRMMAAKESLVHVATLGWGAEIGPGFEAIVKPHAERLAEVVAHVDAALAESRRRGQRPPPQAHYFRAYAELAAGRFAQARVDWRKACATEDAERWRLDRMGAVLEMLGGDLDAAVRLARLAWTDASRDERLLSGYVWALVLDRAGSPAEVRAVLQGLRDEGGHTMARRALESLLPLHERLYLEALDHQVNGETSNALRLWEVYLARPEPAEADKALARRHLDELHRVPPVVM